MSEKMIIGIDPGNTGCLTVIDGDEITFFDTPIVKIQGKKKTHTMLDTESCSSILRMLSSGEDCKVYIEKVNAMPGSDGKGGRQSMGATSAFNFGMGYGIWIGICAALLLEVETVTPQAWKKMFSLMGQEKDAARQLGIKLFPKLESKLSRKKDIGRADALLIAHYGQIKELEMTR